MTDIQRRILRTIRARQACDTTQICLDMQAHRDIVQAELHRLDDAGRVAYRNGFYHMSERTKGEMG